MSPVGVKLFFAENFLELFSGVYTIIYVKRVRAVQAEKKERALLLEYWQDAIARYIKTKREESGKSQKDLLLASRGAISELENGRTNPTVGHLLTVLAAIDGDISELFGTAIPKEFHGPHRRLFDLLAALIETGDEKALEYVQIQLEVAHDRYVVKKRQRV